MRQLHPEVRHRSSSRGSWFAWLGLVTVACTLAACGTQQENPQWSKLAEGYVAAPLDPTVFSLPAGMRLVPDEKLNGVWAESTYRKANWKATPIPGVFWAPVTNAVILRRAGGEAPHRLTMAGREFSYAQNLHALDVNGEEFRLDKVAPGQFLLIDERLYVVLEPDAEPDEEALYRAYFDRGSSDGTTWRVGFSDRRCDGFPVWPGESVTRSVSTKHEAVLRFSTVTQRVTAREDLLDGDVRFRVSLKDEVLFEHDQAAGSDPVSESHTVLLPAGSEGELRFEAEGGLCATAFLNPLVGPAQIGDYGARPWGEDRPDLVLFLADTFRADNLEAYGGRSDLTPNLNAFAAESLVFDRAWSPSSWTLPAQASMLTGLFPRQHSAATPLLRLPESLVTVAEHLRAAGYRTGAITDRVFVSSASGLDQGFESFEEYPHTLEKTLESVDRFFEADDGRPVFLFVQTYRTHDPYLVSEETRLSFGDRFDFAVDGEALRTRVFEAMESWEREGKLTEEDRSAVDRYRDLYLGTVIDLDRGFGELLRILEPRHLLESGYLIFTSDHGESFFEHDVIFHGNGLWEEQIRIPLVIRGPWARPGRAHVAASLVDLPHTLSHAAGLPPSSLWLGRSLLDLRRDRPMFSFLTQYDKGTSSVALIDGPRKVVVPTDGGGTDGKTARYAFNLTADPAEDTNLVEENEEWLDDLLHRLSELAAPLFQPLVDASQAAMSPEDLDQLRKLGYLGD